MASKPSGRTSVQSLIEEMEQRIQLSEGDKKAFCKKSEMKMKENRETILKLREDIKQKRKDIANEKNSSEILKTEELKNLPEEKKYLVNKPPDAVLETLDEQTIDLTNALNLSRFETKKRQHELDGIRTQMRNCTFNAGAFLSDDSRMRELENRVDKTNMMCKEAEHIRHTYHQIRAKLEEEHTTFGTVLDEAEMEIKKLRNQLKELKSMQTDVCKGRDLILAELEKKEREYHAKKRKRELEVEKSRKEAEDLRHEVAEIRNGQQKDQQSLTGEMPDYNPPAEIIDLDKLREYEENFITIKATVGVSDTKEMVKRFESQKERQTQLNEMKEKNEIKINELLVEKNNKVIEYQELQFSINKESTEVNEKFKDNLETKLEECVKNMEIAKSKLENQSKLLTDVKTGIEHLTEKMKSINLPPEIFEPAPNIESGELILAQLNFCEEKLSSLYHEEKLLASITNEDRRFLVKSYEDLSRRHDTAATTETKFAADDSSDENEEAASRYFLKRQSQEIIENKTKKRHAIKRKKKLN